MRGNVKGGGFGERRASVRLANGEIDPYLDDTPPTPGAAPNF